MLRRLIWTIGVAGALALAVRLLAAPGGLIPRKEPSKRPADSEPIFLDVSHASGLDFQHFNGGTGNHTLAEITGSGGAMFDYDGDGRLDVYLVQGKLLGKHMAEALSPWRGKDRPMSRLFRNEMIVSPDGSRTLRFTDVTARAGLAFEGYCMGAATGDYDNDGHTDLYVTCLGSNHLFHNRGDGTFEDVTVKAGADDPRWSTSAAFLDYDRDGFLDLYIANYVDFESDPTKKCFAASSARDFCGPKSYKPATHRLLHNRGDGTFEDVTMASGIGREAGAGLGVVAADFNGDGWVDIFAGNDGDPNFLWINQHDGTFRDEALMAGVAYDGAGKAMASMGVDAGDFDGDGTEDLFVTNIMQNTAALFVNTGGGVFEDRAAAAGLAAPMRGRTSFGAGWLDFDNDGWLDLAVVNGAVLELPEQARRGDLLPLRQPKDLFRNTGRGRFENAADRAGPVFSLPEVSRGLIFGDIDNDGDTDLLICNNNGPARLLLNQLGNRDHWLGLRLLTQRGGRDALGASIEVLRPGRPALRRRAHSDGSYCSASDPRVLVGLGSDPSIAGVTVRWPDGRVESWPPIPADRYVTLREGTARAN